MDNLKDLKHYNSNEKNDKKIQDNIRELLIKSANMIINNTILKKYIDNGQIKDTILFHTQTIKEDYKLKNSFLLDSNNKTIIYLPSYFFSEPILHAMEQNSTITNYPELIKEIEMTSLKLITRYSNEENLPLIAYFISQAKQKETKDAIIYDANFKTCGTINPPFENIIKVISYIIGEDFIAEAIQQNDESIIWNAITIKTHSYLITLELMNAIKSLKKIVQMTNEQQQKVTFSRKLYEEKISPLKTAINNINDEPNKTRTIKRIEKYNFDMEDFFFHHLNFFKLPNIKFTKKEINHIEKLRVMFNNKFLYDDKSLHPYIKKKLTQKNQDYDLSLQDYNWIDKIEVAMSIDEDIFKQLRNIFIECFSQLTNKLIKVISLAINNKTLTLKPNEFEDMLNLMTYQTSDKKTKTRTKIQIKKLQNKINKTNKKIEVENNE